MKQCRSNTAKTGKVMIGVKKKENIFFDLFCEQMKKIVDVGETFYDLTHNYVDVEEKAHTLVWMEADCDKETHKMMGILNGTLITPFDREDIYAIIKHLDRIVDVLEKTANYFVIFDIKELRAPACRMSESICQCIRESDIMFQNLKDFKKTDRVLKQVIEVNRLENEGDSLYRQAIRELFREEKDPIEIIKWQEIYDRLEKALDTCESIADAVEGVVMKYA